MLAVPSWVLGVAGVDTWGLRGEGLQVHRGPGVPGSRDCNPGSTSSSGTPWEPVQLCDRELVSVHVPGLREACHTIGVTAVKLGNGHSGGQTEQQARGGGSWSKWGL